MQVGDLIFIKSEMRPMVEFPRENRNMPRLPYLKAGSFVMFMGEGSARVSKKGYEKQWYFVLTQFGPAYILSNWLEMP